MIYQSCANCIHGSVLPMDAPCKTCLRDDAYPSWQPVEGDAVPVWAEHLKPMDGMPGATRTDAGENYWLCCGSKHPGQHRSSCNEAKSGHPERCRFGTAAEHSAWQKPGASGKPAPSALDSQVAGDHYKKMKIQPVEFIHANGIPFIEGCIIKYASRWRDKGGLKDLEKIKHFTELLIELESRK